MNAIIFSAIWGVLMMFTGAFVQSKTLPKYLAITGAALLFLLNGIELYNGTPIFNINGMNMLAITSMNLTFLEVIFAATLLFFMLSGRDVERVGEHVSEYFALIFFVLCGVSLSSTYNTLLLLFLGIEIMSIPLYVLTGADKRNLKSNEASLKYFLMGAFSTGILLMGIAFIYGGNTNASFYIDQIHLGVGKMPVMITVGVVLLIIALSFKVSAAPFHFWTPDVYDGAPTVFTSFMSTIVKAAGFFAFIRLFKTSFGPVQGQWQNLIVFITVATMLIGNVTAVFQQSVKRMLAYSSIAQAGFMLLALFALNQTADDGIILYSAAYSLATIGIFAILIKMNDYTIEGFNGLAKQQPLLGLVATICLLSLTGIPLTAGFTSKFFMLTAAVENGHKFWVVIVAVIFAAISAYYYFRVIQAIYFKEPSSAEPVIDAERVSGSFKILLAITAILILILGIYPEILIGWAHH
ncbi:NADH-quinone oxidoreductase subunit N [Ferruginibacter sp. HRS2-29]|uniref:NADH-quinone oxidoreductase subunit N n=1 Tax=Ferruginibacter sp. HRS2-29 TaxID=2487334 RepID=UPI0020CE7919|nr:NADH-quinone oxidoreductase subunit N [Ferruginibacter sp. HRS2-29]MCP9750277.1 NADH-quinone oxidoreductase subunit N [Ferruginibacter sp. HRS2-29]